jgi:hypothetical protein
MLHSFDDVKIPMSLTHVNLEQNVFSTFPSSFGNTNVTSLNLKSNVIDDMLYDRSICVIVFVDGDEKK